MVELNLQFKYYSGLQIEKSKPLSPRESQIIELISQGESNAEIGEALYITTGTVESHVHRILKKLNAKNRAHAVMLAVRTQIIPVQFQADGEY